MELSVPPTILAVLAATSLPDPPTIFELVPFEIELLPPAPKNDPCELVIVLFLPDPKIAKADSVTTLPKPATIEL